MDSSRWMLQTPSELKLTKLNGFNPMSSKALDSLKQQATVLPSVKQP